MVQWSDPCSVSNNIFVFQKGLILIKKIKIHFKICFLIFKPPFDDKKHLYIFHLRDKRLDIQLMNWPQIQLTYYSHQYSKFRSKHIFPNYTFWKDQNIPLYEIHVSESWNLLSFIKVLTFLTGKIFYLWSYEGEEDWFFRMVVIKKSW